MKESSKQANHGQVGGRPFIKPPRTGHFATNKLHMVQEAPSPSPPPLNTRKSKKELSPEEKALIIQDERVPCSYLLINFIYIIWGLLGITITMVLHLLESKSQHILNFDSSRTLALVPTILMYTSSAATIFAGLGGFISFFVNFKAFLVVYRHLLWIVLSLDAFAAIFSYASWSHVHLLQYGRLLEAVASALPSSTPDFTYLSLWEPKYKDFWPLIQSTFKCCGYDGFMDWIHICGCLPIECCRLDHNTMGACRSMLMIANTSSLSTSLRLESVNQTLIHTTGCEAVSILEQKGLQRDWIVFPLLIALFDFIFMIHGTELVVELEAMLETGHGAIVVSRFRKTIWPCAWIRAMYVHHHRKKKADRERAVAAAGGVRLHLEESRVELRPIYSKSDHDSDTETDDIDTDDDGLLDEDSEKKVKKSLFHAIHAISRRITKGLPIVAAGKSQRQIAPSTTTFMPNPTVMEQNDGGLRQRPKPKAEDVIFITSRASLSSFLQPNSSAKKHEELKPKQVNNDKIDEEMEVNTLDLMPGVHPRHGLKHHGPIKKAAAHHGIGNDEEQATHSHTHPKVITTVKHHSLTPPPTHHTKENDHQHHQQQAPDGKGRKLSGGHKPKFDPPEWHDPSIK